MDSHHINTFEAQYHYDPSIGWNRDEVAKIASFEYRPEDIMTVIQLYAAVVGMKIASQYNYYEFDYDEFCDATELGGARLEYERQQRAQLYIGRIAGLGFASRGIGLTKDIGSYIDYARSQSDHWDKISEIYQIDVDDYDKTTVKDLFSEVVMAETSAEVDVLNKRFGTPKSRRTIFKR